jgi:hypothetical protein
MFDSVDHRVHLLFDMTALDWLAQAPTQGSSRLRELAGMLGVRFASTLEEARALMARHDQAQP